MPKPQEIAVASPHQPTIEDDPDQHAGHRQRIMNTLSVDGLAPLLAPDFRYTSQWVFDEIESAEQYVDYISGKLDTLLPQASPKPLLRQSTMSFMLPLRHRDGQNACHKNRNMAVSTH
ncbi:MAG: hypothetical protein HN712_14580 [Gemmatimonadetes bacterium]|nr:hypothetical protein [Gemmatimonadota bacterium]MBT7861543.1 hypothetical protein [Gemmatimonadota bacterium]